MDVSFFKNDLENDVPMDSEIGKKGHLKLICCGNISMQEGLGTLAEYYKQVHFIRMTAINNEE